MASSSKEGISKELQDQFRTITGASADIATRLLEACGGNLEMAIGMHMDGAEGAAGGAGPAEPARARNRNAAENLSNDASQGQGAQSDDVRAPIPQKQEVLVQETRTNFGNIGLYGRRRQARSVFDGFRDFEAETRQQELDLASGQPKSAKHKRLEDLFRPPIDLMFKGSFHAARDAGVNSNRWLMVNIQNVKEFQCQILNRDVWSNPSVKPIIKEHFIFWQVYNDSEEGKKYMQFYKVYHWPYIAILDPRTGENMVSWNSVDVMSFCELATGYLAEHNQPDGPSPSAAPPAKKKKMESIADADEDAQLQAALKASVVETKVKEPVIVSSDEEFDSDVELETFTDSEDDTDSKQNLAKQKSSEVLNSNNNKDSDVESDPEVSVIAEIGADKNKNHATVPPKLPHQSSTSSTGSIHQDKPSARNLEKSKSHDSSNSSSSSSLPPLKKQSIPSTSKENPHASTLCEPQNNCKDAERGADADGDALASTSDSCTNGENSQPKEKFQFVAQCAAEIASWKDHLGNKDDPESVINIRFPNGKRLQFKVPSSSKLRALILYVQEEGYHKEMYELVTNFPKRRLSYLDVETTLKDHGLFPQETVFVQER